MRALGIVAYALMLLAPGAHASEACLRAVHALAPGVVPSADDFAAADCGEDMPATAVRYDGGMHAVRMIRAVDPDEIVPAIRPSMLAAVSPGQTLYLSVKVGPVTVQRKVEALQPANPGQKLFVRAADGQVMSVLYPGDTQ